MSYEADERGFKPQISYEDSEDLARSGGYDSNANNLRSGNHDSGNYGGNTDNFAARSNNGYWTKLPVDAIIYLYLFLFYFIGNL